LQLLFKRQATHHEAGFFYFNERSRFYLPGIIRAWNKVNIYFLLAAA